MENAKKKSPNAVKGRERLPAFKLHLFITGVSPNSIRAITNIRNICETYLAGRYDLEITDIYQHPEIAGEEQIIALPLLIKRFPLPQRRLIGDLSDINKVLTGLGLESSL